MFLSIIILFNLFYNYYIIFYICYVSYTLTRWSSKQLFNYKISPILYIAVSIYISITISSLINDNYEFKRFKIYYIVSKYYVSS